MTPLESPNDPALIAMLDELERQNESELVEKARESLEETINGLKLTPDEQNAEDALQASRSPRRRKGNK